MYDIPDIGKPATNALANIGITSLDQVSHLNESNLLKIHGIGPKAVGILKEALADKNLSFDEKEVLPYNPDFAVLGSLNCNNSPKRELIRNLIIAVTMINKTAIENLCIDDFRYISYENREIKSISHFHNYLKAHHESISSLEFINIISHGKYGAAEGITINNKGNKIYWAYFVEFESNKKDALIKFVTAYTR